MRCLLAGRVQVQPMRQEPVAIINDGGPAARHPRTNGRRKLMPNGAARFVAHLESLLPGAQRKLYVFPPVRREHLLKAPESEKFSPVEEGRPARRVQRDQWLHLSRRRGHKKSRMDAKKAAAQSASLS